MELYSRRLQTEIGELLVAVSEQGVCRIGFPVELSGRWISWFQRHYGALPVPRDHPLLRQATEQLEEYFEGGRRDFDLLLALKGTPFQLKVWEELRKIPYGGTVSYGEIARRIDCPRGCQAVGAAVGQNPVPIMVPCHRVVGFDGALVGFGGGLQLKERLLELEGERIPFP
jgi:methylated-DNA-[protein]-cysteine S-methyltransferase